MKKLIACLFGLILSVPAMAANLPDGYTELSYITFDGNTHIDTGITPISSDATVRIKFSPASLGATRFLYGQNSDSGQQKIGAFISDSGNLTWQYGPGARKSKSGITANTTYDVTFGNGFMLVDGVAAGETTPDTKFTNNYSILIGAARASTGGTGVDSRKFVGNMYSFTYTLDGTVVAKYIPARRSDGKLGMYNVMESDPTKAFKMNVGTGAFGSGSAVDGCRNLYGGTYYSIAVASSTAYGPVAISGDTWTTDGTRRGIAKIIPVSGNTKYTFSTNGYTGANYLILSEYASIEDMTSQANSLAGNGGASNIRKVTITTKANTRYLLAGVWAYPTPAAGTVVSITEPQLEQGDTVTNYVPYDASCHTPNTCRNLFDIDAITMGYGIKVSDGSLMAKAGDAASDFISVKPNTKYTLSTFSNALHTTTYGVAWYNANKEFISSEAYSVETNQTSQTFTSPANAVYFRFTVYRSNLTNTQLEEGDTATDYVAYCPPIKIATVKFNNAAFSDVVTGLNTAISTIKTVVSNTIAQTTAIGNLQSGKQTMPDSTATNGTCPDYKQCLLVEDNNGTPHWYVISDPFRDFVAPILANNVNAASSTSQNGVPNTYTQVEYIQSERGAYIDTGITYGKFVHDIQFIIDGQRNLLGNGVSDSMFWEATDADRFKFSSASNGYILGNTANRNIVEFYMSSSEASLTIGNDTITHTHGNVNKTYLLFALNGSTMYSALAKLYSLKVYNNSDVLVQNLVPVKRLSDDEVGMYDTVTGNFLTNSGTGDFVAGPTVPNQTAEWSATWAAGNNNGVVAGTVYGTTNCNGMTGTLSSSVATAEQMASNNWSTYGTACWCKASGVIVDGERTDKTNDVYYRVSTSGNCAVICPGYCASYAKTNNGVRQGLFGQ